MNTTRTLPNAYRATALYAGFWYRAAAFLIDMIVLVIATSLADYACYLLLHIVPRWVYWETFVVCWLYFALFESSSWRATPGKRVFGMRVVGEGANRIGFVRASVRVWVVLPLWGIAPQILGFIIGRPFFVMPPLLILFAFWLAMPGFTRRKQALHDWIANTFVVLDPGLQAFRDDDAQGLQNARPRLPRWVAVVPVVAFWVGAPAWGVYRIWHYFQMRSQVSEAAFLADKAKTPMAEYYINRDTPAPDNAAVGLPAPSAMRSRYVRSLEVNSGKIIVTLGEQAASELQGTHLRFTYTQGRYGEHIWQCTSTDIPRDVLPPQCF